MTSPRQRSRPPTQFRPHFTLTLLYLLGFFFVYCMAFAGPPLIETYRGLPPGTAQEDLALASRVAQEAVQPRLLLAFAAAVATTGLLGYAGRLPGVRRR